MPGTRDPELLRLLLEELLRHEAGLDPASGAEGQRKAIHAIKGSAGIAGERALFEALARIERRVSAGEEAAVEDATRLVAVARAALQQGRAIPTSAWPHPADDLAARPIDPSLYGRYVAEMQDRLDRLDHALAIEGDAAAAAAAYREVHAMKSAALAASDDVTAWFCHGIEEQLRLGERSPEDARVGLEEAARWRNVLAEMIIAPDRALETLRLLARPQRVSTQPSPAPAHGRPPLQSEPELRAAAPDEATVRVATATLDRLFERVRQLAQAQARVAEGAGEVQGMASSARVLRSRLAEALRLIGPPRPWGAPAAALHRIESAARELGGLAEHLDRESSGLKETADGVRTESAGAHSDLAAMRLTTATKLFDRVAAAASATARREGLEVKIVALGGETPIDRRVADGLFDPVLQLARNAVTHGIERPAERAARGKPRIGTVRLVAEPRSGGLRIRVVDDGAGVDVSRLRSRAVALGNVSHEVARAADDETLLALLFVPGFTTRESADLLAGRGIGLDLTLEAVRRLGGTIRLTSEPGIGLAALLDVPLERGLVKVIWVEADGVTYALPIQHTRRILLERDASGRVSVALAARLKGRREGGPGPGAGIAIELDTPGDGDAPLVRVDAVGAIEEVSLRRISPLVATAGPYMGAIVRGDELRLCLDPYALAEGL